MIFWRSQPSYYTTIESEENADWDLDVYKLLNNIIRNFEENFYQNERIAYDPALDFSAEDLHVEEPNAKWEIPSWMKEATTGEKLIYEE